MSGRSQNTSSTRPSLERDMKPVVMAPLERKRRAEQQSSQNMSPEKSQKIIKSSSTPSKPSSSAPKRSPPSLLYQFGSTPQPIVTIVIKSTANLIVNQRFNVHQNILCYYSRYFAEQLKRSDPSLDFNPEPIILENVDTSSFSLFLNWVYYQKIRNEEGKAPGLIELAKLWALGERFEITDLQNATMGRLRHEILYPTQFEEFIHFAYGIGEGGDMLRKLAIARLAWTLPEPFKEILGRLPAQAQMDLILELKSQRDSVPKEHWKDIGAAEEFYVEKSNNVEEGEE